MTDIEYLKLPTYTSIYSKEFDVFKMVVGEILKTEFIISDIDDILRVHYIIKINGDSYKVILSSGDSISICDGIIKVKNN